MSISTIKKAEADRTEAAERLIAEVTKTYPVGILVDVEIGNHFVTVEITGHSDSHWYQPGRISGRNIKTGCTRSFDHSQILRHTTGD